MKKKVVFQIEVDVESTGDDSRDIEVARRQAIHSVGLAQRLVPVDIKEEA